MNFDVIVIGGGITGAGVLRDCALRGLSAALIEKDGLGKATTASSSHLIHGGLRYLLYDRLETHLTSWDSGFIVQMCGPLVKRLPILWPVYRGHRHGIENVEVLLKSYDHFQEMKLGKRHLRLSKEEVLGLFPQIKAEGLVGALCFDEWVVDAVGLVEGNVESAKKHGAQVFASCSVKSVLKENGKVRGLDVETPEGPQRLQAKIVVNATGPWTDKTAALAKVKVSLRLQKGTHLVYSRETLKDYFSKAGLLLEAADGKRYVFVIPMGEKVLVGPTDLPYLGNPDEIKASPDEISYLLESMRLYFPSFPENFEKTICGARPILAQKGREDLLSRDYEVYDHEQRDGLSGFVTVSGGKMSAFRKMAQDTTDLICKKIGKNAPCRTHLETLSGEPIRYSQAHPPPDPSLKSFLSRYPHLRQLYALGHLGAEWAKHWASKPLTQKEKTNFHRYYFG